MISELWWLAWQPSLVTKSKGGNLKTKGSIRCYWERRVWLAMQQLRCSCVLLRLKDHYLDDQSIQWHPNKNHHSLNTVQATLVLTMGTLGTTVQDHATHAALMPQVYSSLFWSLYSKSAITTGCNEAPSLNSNGLAITMPLNSGCLSPTRMK